MTDERPAAFEELLSRVEKIVERLQRDDVTQEEALALFKEGSELTTRCDNLLSTAELRVQELTSAVHERFVAYGADGSEGAEGEDPHTAEGAPAER